jgi:GDSL-like lipase/acylhydrolase family protein/SGNH-like hydrolase/esterase family protein
MEIMNNLNELSFCTDPNHSIRKDKILLRMIFIIYTSFFIFSTDATGQVNQTDDTLKFYDGQLFTIIGKYHSEKNYTRFPQEYKNKLREAVWSLGQHSTGISIRFRTNASDIIVRWTALNDGKMDHMAYTGIKGVDLYAHMNNKWKYVNTGRVKGKDNEFTMIKSEDKIFREYLLNLPLYDGIESLSIGVNTDAEITIPEKKWLIEKKPVVYYGSSIAQGGCASRPGMAFTNILERAMDRSFVNMGFSGSGTFDIPVGEAMCEIDAALYVIDCNPNTKMPLIYERAIELVKFLKKKRPEIPILLVEAFYYERGFVKPQDSNNEEKNLELHRSFMTLLESGIQELYYKKGEGLIGYDHEGTVDGVHPNDLGMMRIANGLQPSIEILIR